MNVSTFLTTLQSNYQFITFLLNIMDLHFNSDLGEGVQCTSNIINVQHIVLVTSQYISP